MKRDRKAKNYIPQLQSYISEAGIFFCYFGPMSQEIIEDIGTVILNHIKEETKNLTLALRIFSIFVEQAQNIEKYSQCALKNLKLANNQLMECLILSGKKNNKYFIEFGNFINNSEKTQLEKRLESLINIDKTDLFRSYKDQMVRRIDLERESVGAGLIEIARNATEPLEYEFKEVDNNYSFFSLTAIV